MAKLATALHREGFPWDFPPANLQAYAEQVSAATGCRAYKANPKHWFREVVAKQSPYGHVDHFPRHSFLLPKLREQGFEVDYHDLPTPLAFDELASFARFFNDAFALKAEIPASAPVPEDLMRLIEERVDEHLGITRDAWGTVWVGWRSGYYVISAPRPKAT